MHTKSANESNSCPINEDFSLHRATLPSKKSKNNPNGIKANANQRFVRSVGSDRQYRIDDRIDMTRKREVRCEQAESSVEDIQPQNPVPTLVCHLTARIDLVLTIYFSDQVSQV